MGWASITVVTKIPCTRFWLRLSKMSHSRLNYIKFAQSCRLAGNGRKNWAPSIKTCLDDLNTHLGFSPSIDNEHFLQFYKDIPTNLYQLE